MAAIVFMPRRTSRQGTLPAVGGAALTIVIVLLMIPLPTRAQLRGGAMAGRPVRIEGYWNRDRGAPGVLDSVPFTSAEGGPSRTFGITALQAYKPEEEGVRVLRHSGLQSGLRVLGSADTVRKFMDASETGKVVVFGVYRPSTATLTLNSVEIDSRTDSR